MLRVVKEICIQSSCLVEHTLVPVLGLVLGASVATLRRLKMKNKNSFKDDIERAERNILIFSWVGIIASIGVIVSGIWCVL